MTSIEKLCIQEANHIRLDPWFEEKDYPVLEGIVFNAGMKAVYMLPPKTQYLAVQQGLANMEDEPEYMLLKDIAVGLILRQIALVY